MSVETFEDLTALQLERIRNAMIDSNTNISIIAFLRDGYILYKYGRCVVRWNTGLYERVDAYDLDKLIAIYKTR